jgi:hypothetical protein
MFSPVHRRFDRANALSNPARASRPATVALAKSPIWSIATTRIWLRIVVAQVNPG